LKRPPDRKVVLAALVLLVAAGVLFSRPVAGTADSGERALLMLTKPGR
jgi:hypothetical protein